MGRRSSGPHHRRRQLSPISGESLALDRLSGRLRGQAGKRLSPATSRTARREHGAFRSYGQRRCRSRPSRCAKPKVLIPVFPGTNCEYDSAKAVDDAGAEPEIHGRQQPDRPRHGPQRGATSPRRCTPGPDDVHPRRLLRRRRARRLRQVHHRLLPQRRREGGSHTSCWSSGTA